MILEVNEESDCRKPSQYQQEFANEYGSPRQQ